MVKLLDTLLQEESSGKRHYMNLIRFSYNSEIYSEDLALVYAKYFAKFEFRFGFNFSELDKLNSYFQKYGFKRQPKIVIQKIAELFN
jgi:hypothetical protein